jgi:hypothetical protein
MNLIFEQFYLPGYNSVQSVILISQKIELFITTAVRTRDHTNLILVGISQLIRVTKASRASLERWDHGLESH